MFQLLCRAFCQKPTYLSDIRRLKISSASTVLLKTPRQLNSVLLNEMLCCPIQGDVELKFELNWGWSFSDWGWGFRVLQAWLEEIGFFCLECTFTFRRGRRRTFCRFFIRYVPKISLFRHYMGLKWLRLRLRLKCRDRGWSFSDWIEVSVTLSQRPLKPGSCRWRSSDFFGRFSPWPRMHKNLNLLPK